MFIYTQPIVSYWHSERWEDVSFLFILAPHSLLEQGTTTLGHTAWWEVMSCLLIFDSHPLLGQGTMASGHTSRWLPVISLYVPPFLQCTQAYCRWGHTSLQWYWSLQRIERSPQPLAQGIKTYPHIFRWAPSNLSSLTQGQSTVVHFTFRLLTLREIFWSGKASSRWRHVGHVPATLFCLS